MRADLTPQDHIEKINEAWRDIYSLTVMIKSVGDMDHDDNAAPNLISGFGTVAKVIGEKALEMRNHAQAIAEATKAGAR